MHQPVCFIINSYTNKGKDKSNEQFIFHLVSIYFFLHVNRENSSISVFKRHDVHTHKDLGKQMLYITQSIQRVIFISYINQIHTHNSQVLYLYSTVKHVQTKLPSDETTCPVSLSFQFTEKYSLQNAQFVITVFCIDRIPLSLSVCFRYVSLYYTSVINLFTF